jgi:hypothetical protein
MRILCDRMLGSLAKWLRWLGHDTEYAGRVQEEADVLARASGEGRTLVTRSSPLAARARKRGVETVLIESRELDQQLEEAARALGVVDGEILGRCGECNHKLEDAARDAVAGIVPAEVLSRHSEFWICPGCGRTYWEGTHFRGIEERIARLRSKAVPTRGGA